MKSFALSHQGYHRQHNEDAYLEQSELGIFMVADGIGSLAESAWASQTLVQPFVFDLQKKFYDQAFLLKRELRKRHQHLFYAHPDLQQGATLVALLISATQALIYWAGDARVYCFSRHTQRLHLLTRDHTHQQYVTRALGVMQQLQLDEVSIDLRGDEIFLLCSDGLSKSVDAATLTFLLAQDLPLSLLCQKLIEFSLSRGSTDNITTLVVKLC